jgi:hypothetical protein
MFFCGYVALSILALRLLMIKMNNIIYYKTLSMKIINSIEKIFDYIIDLKNMKGKKYILSASSNFQFKLI